MLFFYKVIYNKKCKKSLTFVKIMQNDKNIIIIDKKYMTWYN